MTEASDSKQTAHTPLEQAYRRAVAAAEYLAHHLPRDGALEHVQVSGMMRLAMMLESARSLYDSLSDRAGTGFSDPRLADTDVAEIDDAFAALAEQLQHPDPSGTPRRRNEPTQPITRGRRE